MKNSINDFAREDCERIYKQAPPIQEDLTGSSLLITGGTGFLGLWLAEYVSYLNDNYNSGIELHLLSRNSENFSSSVPHLANKTYINLIQSDVRSITELPRNLNYIIHAAGDPDNRVHTTRPFDTISTISDGTSAILRAADCISNLRMFVNISSGNVYGVQPDSFERIPENYTGIISPTQLNSVYAESKRFTESLVTAARSELRLPAITLRPFSFLGPYQAKDAPWATNNFIFDAMNKRSIRILGDGKTIRTIMYGVDFAAWVLVIMSKSITGKVYNIGSDDGRTLSDLAQIVSRQFNPHPEVMLNCSLAGEIPNSKIIPDVSLAKNDFQLDIYTDVATAIERTVSWNKLKNNDLN